MINQIDPEEFLNKTHDWFYICNNSNTQEEIVNAVKKYGKEMWNAALEWAAENANTYHVHNENYDYDDVDKDSILKGKL